MSATIKRLMDDLKSANEYKEQQAKMIVGLQDEIGNVRKGMREGGGERMTDEVRSCEERSDELEYDNYGRN